MGQLNCQCQNDAEILSVEENIQLCSEKPHKHRTRVKSIVSPKLISPVKEDQWRWESAFCQVSLFSQMDKYELEVNSKGIKVGTESDDVVVSQISAEDVFEMRLKYHDQILYAKDVGGGMGVYKWVKELSIKKGQCQMIENGGKFVILELNNQGGRWKKITSTGQESGEIKDGDFLDEWTVEVKDQEIRVSSVGFFQHLQDWTPLASADILRCGINFFRVSQIHHYINSY